MGINVIAGAQTVAPAAARAILATLRKRRETKGLPTDDPGYRETLELMRGLIAYTATTTVEDFQQITTGWVPNPPSVLIDDVIIPQIFYSQAAAHVQEALGPANLRLIGKAWWQWRRPGSSVKAEWVEMRADYLQRKRNNDPGKKCMFYVHGGAYYMGGIGHEPQIQRHARKLKGRVFAPRYRLAPQFPFPCALQDIVSAYLYLLTIQDSSTIVIAGDSAGGGLCMALLIILRDQGLLLPTGCSLISPWVDLTHSFPSITEPTEFDYVPAHGFHAKPSLAWPPPTPEEMAKLNWPIHPEAEEDFEIEIDGKVIKLTEQFQMYAQNMHLQCPLVSPILAASLGGLCPLQVIVGGGEVLRDEQIYLAHKAADPEGYPPDDIILTRNGETRKDVLKYAPTDVQLLIFDNLPHAAPTLGHTRGAKHEYHSVAQFAAWALSMAQRADIDLQDGASIYSIRNDGLNDLKSNRVGKAGDPLPPFVNHMIQHRIDMHGNLYPIEPTSEIKALHLNSLDIGFPKASALKGYFKYREAVKAKWKDQIDRVWQTRVQHATIGFERFPGFEVPPPSALAGRRVIGQPVEPEKPRGKIGKGIIGWLYGKFD